MSENKDVDPTKQAINPLAAEEQGGATGSRRSPKNVFAPSPVSLTSVDLQTSHDEQEEEVSTQTKSDVDTIWLIFCVVVGFVRGGPKC